MVCGGGLRKDGQKDTVIMKEDISKELESFVGGNIYAGISGLNLGVDEILLGEGMLLRKTYAHLTAPFIMAFKPASPGKHHPGPWKTAQGGFGFDITCELVIPREIKMETKGRFFLARLIVSLLRFSISPGIAVPVVSNLSFSVAEKAKDNEAIFIPLEIEPRHFSLKSSENKDCIEKDFEWIKTHWKVAFGLVGKHAELKTAFEALDQGQFIRNHSLILVLLWGGLEALFSPATSELRFRVSALIASYMNDSGKDRLKAYKRIIKLYDARSSAAHGKSRPSIEDLVVTFELLRQVVIKIIEKKSIPSKEELEGALFGVN